MKATDLLSTLPGGWPTVPIKAACYYTVSNVDKHSFENEMPVRLCNYTDVYKNDRVSPELELMSATATQDEIEKFHLEAGDVVITKDSESWDDIGIPAYVEATSEDFVCGYHLAFMRPNNDLVHGRFLFRCLQSRPVALQLELQATGVTRYGLPKGAIGNALIPLPALETQSLIADYLDRETARIDALVAEKEKMLALLEEKRTAIISRAVTRGLNPNAPLKPSGLDWLGDIPAHWETRTLKRASSRIDTGSTPSASYMDGTFLPQFLWFTPGDFENGGELTDSKRKIPLEAIEDKETKVFPANAIMVIGIGATLGKVATSPVEFSANQQINVIHPSKETSSEFLLYVLQGFEKVFRANANSATLPILNQERLGAIHIPFPPMEEQLLIAAKIREKRYAEHKISEELSVSISFLKERRAALITAAVTGQIPIEEMCP